jgi:hypothetical protein
MAGRAAAALAPAAVAMVEVVAMAQGPASLIWELEALFQSAERSRMPLEMAAKVAAADRVVPGSQPNPVPPADAEVPEERPVLCSYKLRMVPSHLVPYQSLEEREAQAPVAEAVPQASPVPMAALGVQVSLVAEQAP